MSRVTDHTRIEKIGGDSILFLVVIQVVAGNRYDNHSIREMVEDGNVDMLKIHTKKNLTDVWSKSSYGITET